MDPYGFDRLARSLVDAPSRRGLLRATAVGLLALPFAAAASRREAAAACKNNGEACSRQRAETCCSGTCRKKGGTFRCRKIASARGCSNNLATGQQDGLLVFCRLAPDGLCFVRVNDKPFCANDGACFACNGDADCVPGFGPGARCVRDIECAGGVGAERACVVFRETAED